MPRAQKGVLVQCDASIKAIIMKIDSESHEYVMEELDDKTVLVSPKKLEALKAKVREVLKESQMGEEGEESDSE